MKLKLWEHKDKLYQEVNSGPWSALVVVEKKKASSISQRWNGKRIPLPLWQQITAFLEWTQTTTKSEAMIHLFYDDLQGWDCCALPQEGHQGMTVKLLPEHPSRHAAIAAMNGRQMMGTVHHHCTASAFQSSGDESDELTKEGLHITVGHVGHAEYSIDCRATKLWGVLADMSKEEQEAFLNDCDSKAAKGIALPSAAKGTTLDVHLEDWFELEAAMLEHVEALPKKLQSKVRGDLVEASLCQPCPTVAFPEWWEANVIKIERLVASYPPSAPNWHRPYDGYHGGGGGVPVHRGYVPSQLPEHYQSVGSLAQPKPKFADELREFMQMWGMSKEEVEMMFDNLETDGVSELINAMVECGVDMKAAEATLMALPATQEGVLGDPMDEVDVWLAQWEKAQGENQGLIGG